MKRRSRSRRRLRRRRNKMMRLDEFSVFAGPVPTGE